MELSKRLQAIADLVTEGFVVADIGTDHGYIPIYLTKAKKNSRVIAMDINEGPLERAKEHIQKEHQEMYIETRLSDGLQALYPGEVESVIIAGMGGGLIIKILEEYKDVTDSIKEFILQPQSEIMKVRTFLNEKGFVIIAEKMVFEEGKFYPMMKLKKGISKVYTQEELRYGELLLKQKHPVLRLFLEKEIETKERVLSELCMRQGSHVVKRTQELREEVSYARNALLRYYQNN